MKLKERKNWLGVTMRDGRTILRRDYDTLLSSDQRAELDELEVEKAGRARYYQQAPNTQVTACKGCGF